VTSKGLSGSPSDSIHLYHLVKIILIGKIAIMMDVRGISLRAVAIALIIVVAIGGLLRMKLVLYAVVAFTFILLQPKLKFYALFCSELKCHAFP